MLLRSPSYTLAALALLGLALANPLNTGTFTGCVNQVPSSTSSSASNCDVNECNDYCRGLGFAFAFQSPSFDTTVSGFCTCADDSVNVEQAYVAGTDMQCAASDLQQTALSTSFAYDQNSCYQYNDDPDIFAIGSGQTIESCFSMCASYKTVTWRSAATVQGPDAFSCGCNNVDPTTQTGGDTCGYSSDPMGSWYRFTHGAGPAASGWAKKRSKKRSSSQWCPAGSVACAVKGTDGYECIDATNELESCGGCTAGLFHAGRNSTMMGIDCTTLPGVRRYGVTCMGGECVASACQAGYMLVGGTCLAV